MSIEELRFKVDQIAESNHRATLSYDQRQEFARFIPNLAALHPQTEAKLWREFKPLRDEIEWTIYYQEPGGEKYRIDAVVRAEDIDSGEIHPGIVKIKYWGTREGYFK